MLRTIMTLLFIAVLTTGCIPRKKLSFDTGTPYQTPYQVDGSAFIVVPDEILEREFKVRTGGSYFWEKKMFIVPVYDLYRAEMLGHLKSYFRGDVTVTTHALYADAEAERKRLAAETDGDEPNQSELDKLLEELSEKESDSESSERTVDQINKDLNEALNKTILAERDARYLIYLNNAIITAADNGRIIISFDAQISDKELDVVLYQNRYTSRTSRFKPGQSMDTNQDKLQGLLRAAFNGLMKQMIEDMAVAMNVESR